MRWIDQTEFGHEGNCVQASIASILGLSLEEVPNFIKLHPGDNQESVCDFWDAVEDFLESQGYWFKTMSVDPQAGRPDVLYLASGMTKRGFHHMVVKKGFDLIHDPHPDRQGLSEETAAWMLVPFDPALLMLRKKADIQLRAAAHQKVTGDEVVKVRLVSGFSADETVLMLAAGAGAGLAPGDYARRLQSTVGTRQQTPEEERAEVRGILDSEL